MVVEVTRVVWLDSSACTTRWIRRCDVDDSPTEILSIGAVVAESLETITLAAHFMIDGDGETIHCPLTIPKHAIVSREMIARLERR